MKILDFLVNLKWLGGIGESVNGKKTVIGALSLLLYTLNAAPAFLPQLAVAPHIADVAQTIFEFVGITLTSLGLTGKAVKKVTE
tara:strand:+ start:314 stop:565 length:252 start_codon:yes stop_codon:yes gene_type:complete